MSSRLRQVAQIAVVAGMLVVLSACGSMRPVKYYALDTQSTAPAAGTPQFPVTLLVARVTSSHLYRDDRLVFGYGSLELGTYEYHRWAEPPVDMIQDALITALRGTGKFRSVSAVASNIKGQYIVRSHLLALDEVDKPELVARFSYQVDLYDARSAAIVWSQTYTHDQPVSGKGVPNVVDALEENVTTGVHQLTAGIGDYFASHPNLERANP
jgi:ABC-type uncharacterized transport system auxiliary subunit